MTDLAAILMAELRVDSAKVRSDVEKGIAGVNATKAGESTGTTFGSGFKAKAGAAFTSAVGTLSKVAVGSALVIGGASIKMAADFQAGLTTLVTGAGEAETNLKLVGAGIMSIATATGTSTKQLTAGMFMIESAGFHGAAGLDVLKAAAQGAKIGNADLGVVANALTTVMKDYGAKAGTAAQATDGLMAIVSRGKTHLEDLAGSMARVLPTAAALNISFADVGGAMATMTGEGTSARLAAMGLNATILALSVPSATASKAMSALGLSSKQVADDLTHKGLVYALNEVQAAALRAGPVGSAPYVAAMKAMLGGTNGLRVGLQLTGTHMKDLVANTAAVGAASHAAGKDVTGWALVQKDVNQQMEVLKARVEVAGITIGQKLLPVVSSFLGFLTKTHLIIPLVAATIGILTAALVVQGGMWAVNAAKAVASFAEMTAGAVVWAATQAASLITTAALWVMYTLGVESAGLATVIATGGIILVVAAVAVAAYELWKHWSAVWGWVKGAAESVYNWLKANWPLVAAILLGPVAVAALEITKHWDTIKGLFTGFLGTVKSTLAGVGDAIAKPFITGFGDVEKAWGATTSAVAGAWRAVSSFFSGIYQDIVGPFIRAQAFISSSFDAWWKSNGDALKEIWHGIWAGMQAVFHAVWDPLVGAFKKDWALLQDIFRVGSAVVNAVWRAGWAALQVVFHAVWDPLIAAFRTDWALLQDIFRVGTAVVTAVWHAGWAAVQAVVQAVWTQIQAVISAAWSAVTGVIRAGWLVIQAAFSAAAAVVTGIWNTLWAVATAVVKVAWAGIQAFFKITWDIIVGVFTVAINLLTGRWGAAWTAIKNTGTQIWNAISAYFKAAWAAMTGLWQTALTQLQNVWNSCWNAVKSVLSAAWQWIVSTVLNPVKAMFTQTIPGWWDAFAGFVGTRLVTPWKNTIKAGWDWIVSNVFNPVKAFVTQTIPGWWDAAVGAIGSAWNKIKKIVHDPAQFVVNTILGTLVSGFDTLISWVGLKGPAVPHMASKGWKVPGYGGGDKHLALLEGGESVVPKELTPQIAGWLKSKGVPGHQFGWVGDAWNGVKGAVGNIGNFASTMWSKVTDVAGMTAALATGNTGALIADFAKLTGGKIPGSAGAYLSALAKFPPKAIADVVGWLVKHIGPEAGAAIVAYAKTFLGKIPYVWGGTNLSSAGADCSGFTQAVYSHFAIGAPRTSEAQGGWVKKGPPVAGGLAFYHCLPGDQPVLTSAGPVPIADVEAGMMVATWDQGRPAWRRCAGRSAPRRQMTYRVSTATATLEASGNHPFLTVRHGWAWIQVDDLRPGDLVCRYDQSTGDFREEPVTAIEPLAGADTYDITVEGTHCFIAGGLVVHNSPGGGADPGHVAIVQDMNTVVSQGGGMGPKMMGIRGMPLLFTGSPPGGFGKGGAGGGATAGPGAMSPSTIAALWVSLGGPASAAANMARIAMSESGDVPDIVQKGQPPGLTGYGLFQITPTSGIVQNGAFGNLLNASNNIRAAISLYKSSGYLPWTSDPVASGLVASGLSYGDGGPIREPVLGVGRSGALYRFGERGETEWVTPQSKMGELGGGTDVVAELRRVTELLARLNDISEAAPARTGQHVGAHIAGAGQDAAFRARYPAGGI